MPDFYKESKQPILEQYGIDFFPQQWDIAGIIARAHIHPAIEFIYIHHGIFEISVDSEDFIAEDGDLVLFRSNTVHTTRYIGEGKGKYFVLKINPTLLFHIFSEHDTRSCILPFIHKNSGDISHFPAALLEENIKRILSSMIYEYEHADGFFYAIERSLAAEFLISLLRDHLKSRTVVDDDISEKSVALIHESVKYINENYASDITPTDCAASIHLSYSYFAKLFRAVMGKTFKEYLTGVRLAKAHNILISTSLPITDVATSCGYGNLSYFISEYRKIYGKTPRETRKELSLK